ncbi:ribonuclease H-like domain-containing protein [Tanacetum coccineum]
MIQPEPEGSTEGYLLVSVEVLRLVKTGKMNGAIHTESYLFPEHAEFDESDTHVLERFDTSAGNPIKEILLKLNLLDHRILKDRGEGRKAYLLKDKQIPSVECVCPRHQLPLFVITRSHSLQLRENPAIRIFEALCLGVALKVIGLPERLTSQVFLEWSVPWRPPVLGSCQVHPVHQAQILSLESLEARIVVHQKNEAVFEEDVVFLTYDVKVRDNSITELKNQLEEALKEKDDLKLKLEKFETSSKKLTKLINNQISVNNKTGVAFDSQMNENELHDSHMNKSEVFESASNSSVNESEEDNNQVYGRYKAGEGYHAVPPPYTGNFMPPRPDMSFAGLDDSIFKSAMSETVTSVHETEISASKTSKESMEKPKTVRSSAPLIEEWESDSDDDCMIRPSIEHNKPSYAKVNFDKSDENTRKSVIEQHTYRQAKNLRKSQSSRVDKRNWNGMMTRKLGDGFEFKKKACFVCGSLNHLIKDCNFYENKMNFSNNLTHPHPRRNFVPSAVITNSGKVPVNTAKQSFPRAATSTSTARYVNTAASRPTMNGAKPSSNIFHKSHSPVRRTINQRAATKNSDLKEKVNTAKVNNVTTAGPKAVVSVVQGHEAHAGNPQHALKDQGIVDSGCSKHMTSNKAYLSDYQEIDGGFVAFGGSSKGGIENQINHKVKIIRCDNETKFKNTEMNQFCEMKGIRREFSVARTPQQNRVAKRKNRTLIEAARAMLIDSLLPTTFWAEAINTACYVHNRVLITKPHNKKPYELLIGRSPNLDFMRPFGCPVTILNTLDHLGKFEGKANKGFLVGYSVNSKAFRVFNSRTKKVKENMHIKFLENKPNIAGSGPEWLFDIESLKKSMNYEPVSAGNQLMMMHSSDDEFVDDAGKKNDAQYPAKDDDKNGHEKDFRDQEEALRKQFDQETKRLVGQGEATITNSTNRVNTVSPSVSAVGQSFDNNDLPTDPLMLDLEDSTSIFRGAYDDEDVGAEADLINLETIMNVCPIPTTRIHKDHPKD